jgi:ABC-2 type transport system ATP-binding protein
MNASVLRVASVSRTLGGHRVLDGVSMDVSEGAIHGFVGQNGAGKTTLIRIAVGLTRPDAGSIEARAPVGYLPEERGLYQRPRAAETLRYLARLKGLSEREADAEVDRWLLRMEMSAFAARRIEHQSKGQQQKFQLAAALIGDPPLVVLDEPFSGLDPLNTRLVCDLIRETAAAGRGVLVSAHQLTVVERLCTHVTMLAAGRVVLSGTIDEVRAAPQDTLEQLFVAHASGDGVR